VSGWQRSCGNDERHVSHTFWTSHVMGDEAWECPGRWEHTDACDAWADMNGSDCTCGLDPEPPNWEQTETKIERTLDDAGYDVLQPWRSDVVRLWAAWDRERECHHPMVSEDDQ
jgi:hypothetical protein